MAPVLYAKTTEEKEPLLEMHTLSDLPRACQILVEKLRKQPLFDGHGSPVRRCRILSLQEADDTRICQLFNENARRIRGDNSPCQLHAFGTGHHALFTRDSVERMGHGLTLWLDDKGEEEFCSSSALEASYEKVVSEMTNGWSLAQLKDYPGIVHRQNSEHFSLLIKETRLYQEVQLIQWIAKKLSIAPHIHCHREWKNPAGHLYEGPLYLWIRKPAVELVVQTLSLAIQIESDPKDETQDKPS